MPRSSFSKKDFLSSALLCLTPKSCPGVRFQRRILPAGLLPSFVTGSNQQKEQGRLLEALNLNLSISDSCFRSSSWVAPKLVASPNQKPQRGEPSESGIEPMTLWFQKPNPYQLRSGSSKGSLASSWAAPRLCHRP